LEEGEIADFSASSGERWPAGLIEWDQGAGSQGGAAGTRLEEKIIMVVAFNPDRLR
jgi:hypothetical protein